MLVSSLMNVLHIVGPESKRVVMRSCGSQHRGGVCGSTGIRLKCLCVCSIYFNPIGGRPGIISPQGVDIDASEFPADWFEGLEKNMYKARRYIAERNKYKVVQFVMDSCGWHACWCLISYLHSTSYTSCLYHLSMHTSCILCALYCQSCWQLHR